MQNKKVTIKGFLKLHTSQGDISKKPCLTMFSDITNKNMIFSSQFWHYYIKDWRSPSFIDGQRICSGEKQVRGYVAKKTMTRTDCKHCKQHFGNRDLTILDLEIDVEILNYFDTINKGGFIYPCNFLLKTIVMRIQHYSILVFQFMKKYFHCPLNTVSRRHWYFWKLQIRNKSISDYLRST